MFGGKQGDNSQSEDYQKLFPTHGDLAREQVSRCGLLYFEDVQADIQLRLGRLPVEARRAFALACAERLMRRHEDLPSPRPFTLGWRPLLDAMWLGLEGVARDADDRVREALRTFHASSFDHDLGQEGPDDANQDAAAASIYAAECFACGDAEFAGLAAERAVDSVFVIASDDLALEPNAFAWDPAAEPMPLAQEAMHPAVQAELERQLSELELLEREGATAGVLRRLKQTGAGSQ